MPMSWGKFFLYPHPGEKPTFLNEKGQYISSKTDEEAKARQLQVSEWEQRVIQFGFQQMRITSVLEKEERRQDTMERMGMDRVECTTNLHRRKGLL